MLRLEAHIARCQLVVVDELGYIPLEKIGAEHLFGFFSQCYERTSLIVTTNLPFAEWPQIFAGDERLAGRLDRPLDTPRARGRNPGRQLSAASQPEGQEGRWRQQNAEKLNGRSRARRAPARD